MAPKAKADTQFTFHEVSCMMAAMNANGITLGAKHFDLMASLDGERTASGFEHKFRAVKARGKELAAQLAAGPDTPSPSKSAKKAITGSKKRDKTAHVTNGDDDEEEEATPSKKPKVTKAQKSKTIKVRKESSEQTEGDANGFETSYFEEAMVPAE